MNVISFNPHRNGLLRFVGHKGTKKNTFSETKYIFFKFF